MLSVTLLCVGRLKDRFFEDASDEYLKRLKAYAKVTVCEVKAQELSQDPGAAETEAALEKEAAELIKKIPAGAKVVSMCIEGRSFSSEELASFMDTTATGGCSHIVFIIGGSYGLAERIKKMSDVKMSMSKMTFPHRLARVMLLEQIYRAFKINAGEKYHK